MNTIVDGLTESRMTLELLKKDTLIIGGCYSGGLESLQDLLLEALQQGLRIQVFDGKGDWLPATSRIGTYLHTMEKAYQRTPVHPVGQIPVMRIDDTTPDSQELKSLWETLDPKSDAPSADIYVFSRTLGWLRQHWTHLETWLGYWGDKARIIVYLDGRLDGDGALPTSFSEMILFPHELNDYLARNVIDIEISARDWDSLEGGRFLRIPEPLNTLGQP